MANAVPPVGELLLFPTVASTVGSTPLVRLQRLGVTDTGTSSVVLLKLEGNNPAGSVKDRPAMRSVMSKLRFV